jgi:protein O-GlcNAc transferase
MNTAALFQEAIKLHEKGAVAEAAARYEQLLIVEPNNVEVLFRLGRAHCQQGRLAEGADLLRRALMLAPDHARANNLLGMALDQLGRPLEALPYFDRAIASDPNFAHALANKADALSALDRYVEAIQHYDRALAIDSNSALTLYNRGVALHESKRYDIALASFDRAIAANPTLTEAHANRAKTLAELERYGEALASLDAAIALRDDIAEFHSDRGHTLKQLLRYEEAQASYARALALEPDKVEAWLGRGNLLNKLKRYDEAFAAFDKALSLKPDLAEAWLGCGNVFFAIKRYDEAVSVYDKALALKPDLADAWLGRGNIFFALKRYDDAFSAYDKALVLKPDLAEAWLGRGNVFLKLKRHDETISAYDKALTLKLDLAEAWLGRGNIFKELKRYDEAFAAYDQALTLKPDLAEAWLGRGNIFRDLKRYDEAFAAYDQGLTLKPDLAEAWLSRGNLLNELMRYDEAFAAYDKALALKPDLNYAESNRLRVKMLICDWSNFESECSHLISTIREGTLVSTPFSILAIPSSPADQLKCAKLFVVDNCPASSSPLWKGERYRRDKIRIAYLSADFHDHSTAYLIAELFELHDRARFEITGISFGPNDKSEMRARLMNSMDRFLDVQFMSDRDVALMLRNLEIDIAVDLKGPTADCRPYILAHRPAPIQVAYLGYQGTTGADFIDYVIGDKIALPFELQPFFTEKIIHLPDCHQISDSKRKIPEHTPSRSEFGLPRQGFVFCNFNNNNKITPEIFEIWMRLLSKMDGSVLWLMSENNSAKANLSREASAHRIDPARLIFSESASINEHLLRHRVSDLFLDTSPLCAHTSASRALWVGLPMLTIRGHTFAGRITASMLHAIGLPELVADNLSEYETLALKLATNAPLLEGIRRKLAEKRLKSPVFDTDRTRRNLEAAYTIMWERYQRGEPPASFAVDPID